MEINEIMYRMRNIRNLTRKEAAEAAGISNGYYLQLENGDKNPRPKMLLKIADGLNFSMDVFFTDDKRFLVNSIIALAMMTPDKDLNALCENLELCRSLKGGS